MRVLKYEATVYYPSTGSSHTSTYPFTEAHAAECGGVLEPDGLNIALAEALCRKWTTQGSKGDIRRSYRIPLTTEVIDYTIRKHRGQ